jgi:hypothetical protein
MELAEKGLPLKALRVAIVMTPNKELHAVLTIATDKGDYALDNLTDKILPWSATDYRWIARQDSQKSWNWVSFDSTSIRIAMLEAETGSQLEWELRLNRRKRGQAGHRSPASCWEPWPR